MHRMLIDEKELSRVLDLPEEFKGKRLEVFIREYVDDDLELTEISLKLQRKAKNAAFMDKTNEIFFFEKDELPPEKLKRLVVKLKNLGYRVELKESSRGTQIIRLEWKNG